VLQGVSWITEIAQLVKKYPALANPKAALPCLKEKNPMIASYYEPVCSSLHLLDTLVLLFSNYI
jgi:hypothetical protein